VGLLVQSCALPRALLERGDLEPAEAAALFEPSPAAAPPAPGGQRVAAGERLELPLGEADCTAVAHLGRGSSSHGWRAPPLQLALALRLRLATPSPSDRSAGWGPPLFLVPPAHGGGGGGGGGGGRGGSDAAAEGGGAGAWELRDACGAPLAGLATLGLGAACAARFALECAAGGAPRCLVWAPYWLINKTGLRLAYLLQSDATRLLEPDVFDELAAAAAGHADDPHAAAHTAAHTAAAAATAAAPTAVAAGEVSGGVEAELEGANGSAPRPSPSPPPPPPPPPPAPPPPKPPPQAPR